jgi:tetratricopeptide (TPR) repeat protein
MCNKTIAHCFFILVLMVPHCLQAAPPCNPSIAKVASAQGQVHVQAYGARDWQSVHRDDSLCPGDTLRTSRWSRATLNLKSGAVLTVDQNTTMSFSAPQDKVKSWFINLLEGVTFFRSRQPQHLDVHTPFINAVHEGTEFMVAVSSQKTEISVFDGQVSGENSAGKIKIGKGFKGIAEANRPPRVQALKIIPEDAVQWMLYYPPIVDYSHSGSPTADSHLNATLTAYRQGDSQLALAKLDEIPLSQQDTHYLTLKAALLLTVGRLDEAQPLIQQAQRLEPKNSDAFALQAIIAVAKNQQQAALGSANKAVTANPQSSVAKIAQSYAYQSLFNIDEALKATQEATRLTPDNALAWARLSELQLSQGDHDAALKSAQKAQAINPKIARTQTIVGFADLAQTDIHDAKRAFEQALVLDSSDPLARLGLGLAKIRKGDLEAGKSELETAVNLDPNNAVIRSYLGKAYYELRNKDYAGKEFEIAKEMDPKDPTPYFYDAILKQTTNRPVEALHDMRKAIELNDNRGVYRSKLLLDSDSAARSASLGRIYNDLGFQQRGLLEGWNSVNQDPSNYSAHRLLADNYAALPRHEVSRLSELLKAQLLQPINITPVQPQAAESNILILDGLGSSITSFNEYNPLFTRNRFALQASGFYGSRDTISDEVVQSGVWDRFSYSLGQFHYQTDGFRPNNDQKKNIYNFFAQAEITKDTNVQVELRRSEHEFGDINQGFYKDKFSPTDIGFKDSDIVRGGLHHAFAENSDLLMSVLHKEEDSGGLVTIPGLQLELDALNKTKGTQYELQHIYRHNNFDLTFGMDYLINQSGNLGVNIDNSIRVTKNNETEHKAFYVYSNVKIIPKLLMTVGFSQDFYQSRNEESLTFSIVNSQSQAEFNRNPANPKFGLTWMPTKDTTFRFAAFRSLKRGIIQKQTLEPTQIAGFNQFNDDIDGSIAKRIGFGLDHKFNNSVFIGAEVSRRYLEVPNLPTLSNTFENTRWNEKNARAYVNWTPSNLFAFGVEYNYEKLNRNNMFFELVGNGVNFFTELETHRAQIFGNFYHPSGFLSKLNLSYVDQTGNFVDAVDNSLEHRDSSRFWLLDAEVGYRLPKRHGLVVLGIKNLLDERFNYQAVDINQPTLSQGRFLFGRLTLSF